MSPSVHILEIWSLLHSVHSLNIEPRSRILFEDITIVSFEISIVLDDTSISLLV